VSVRLEEVLRHRNDTENRASSLEILGHVRVRRHSEDRLREDDSEAPAWPEELQAALNEQQLRWLTVEENLALTKDCSILSGPFEFVAEIELLKNFLALNRDLGAKGWIGEHHIKHAELYVPDH
jgi:hypothetical protein